MSAPSGSDLTGQTAALLRQSGWPGLAGLEPLEGGKNNRVFRVMLEDGRSLVLKSYFADPRDPRDRVGAEWDFLTYAWARGLRDNPEPIACRREHRLGLYGFVPGRKLVPAEVSEAHVAKAADFIVALNRSPRDVAHLAPASEACFSIAQHIETVERRIGRLSQLAPEADDRAMVDTFVATRLRPAWREVEARLSQALVQGGIGREAPLEPADVIVSPSDFGFHNALFNPAHGALGFIDFEYAGRDDPAKLVCDFFCQPEIPAPPQAFDFFAGQIVTGLGLAAIHHDRCRLLLDLYRVKWAMIILNAFMPLGQARRAFAEHESAGAAQIARAEAQIACIATSSSAF